MTIRDRLKEEKLIFDGAFGTYYAQIYDTKELPELANTLYPERVREIHTEYIAAGAQVIRTNTFASNTVSLGLPWEAVQENLRQGYTLAQEAADEKSVYVAADIGQIPCDNQGEKEKVSKEYVEICRTFLEQGAKIFVFETFADMEDIGEALAFIGDRAFVIVQFSVNQFGYSHAGLSARKLIEQAEDMEWIDAVGFNCGVGPGHMQQIMRGLHFSGRKRITALPNAGYPQIVSNRMIFDNKNVDYFVTKVNDIVTDGADIVGGCCGTTPEYIRRMRESVSLIQQEKAVTETVAKKEAVSKQDNAFFAGKAGKKLIAVELAPPLGSDDEKLMDAAHLLLRSGVDVLTFPDSPSGRTRADSILMAEKVARETGMCVMPHICCRDKNAIAMRSQLLGAHINHIHNFLVITGDPIPSIVRGSIKSVFNFDSVGLMRLMNDMNEDQFEGEPICYGGAINQGRRNLDVEIGRVKKKMEAGATFFLTQPVSTKDGVERVRRIKEETGARILCGIMPFVSLKNAAFMKNEMTGIDVTDEVLVRYREDMTREEGEQAGIQLAKEMMSLTEDFADGYYFSFPFNRVSMLEKILEK
ncbi:MAG: bifunctional homocysteine S-methyltransferase/methylenetetrahydrofolate reductase [Lachnospiraceae bacterium]|nr:bifunctional homocysteine S-methyltransferase/methylenetetrahydrofolate reductase [Lachnospiraceae bacterium]MBQ7777143.1 bifunctional homocysteine S-methyltransferase/methylenetetrahydrofolate reductase [Lachnospiraceae bacterium]